MTSRQKGLLYILITISLWGFLSLVMRFLVTQIDPYSVACFRLLGAGMILLIWLLYYHREWLRKPPPQLLLSGLLLGCNYLGFNKGVEHGGAAATQIFIQAGPLVLAVGSIIFFYERLLWRQVGGFAFAIMGFLFFFRTRLNALETSEEFYWGILWTLFGAFTWGAYALLQKQLLAKGYAPPYLNMVQFLCGGLLWVVHADFPSTISLSWKSWYWLLFLMINTLVAYGCLTAAMKRLKGSTVSIMVLTNPIITFIIIVFLHLFEIQWIQEQPIGVYEFVGAIMVISGASVVLWQPAHMKVRAK